MEGIYAGCALILFIAITDKYHHILEYFKFIQSPIGKGAIHVGLSLVAFYNTRDVKTMQIIFGIYMIIAGCLFFLFAYLLNQYKSALESEQI